MVSRINKDSDVSPLPSSSFRTSINPKTSRDTSRVADMAGDERPSGLGDDEKPKYPLGFRFKPTLREQVEFYLLPKLLDKPTVPNDTVTEADAYECDPEILTKRYEEKGVDDNWYFLSPRSRRYPGGDRPSRRTADNRGRWKPSTGQSKPGKNAGAGNSKAKKGLEKDRRVGAVEFTENTLAYYVGEPKKETKTKWLMHELTIPELEKQKGLNGATGEKPKDHMLLNKYVMCRIYKSPLKKWREPEDDEASTSSAPACDEEVPTSSQSGATPESVAGTSAPTPSSKRAGKRPAVEQPTGHANAPNKRASSQQTMMPPGPSGPPTYANGGGGMRVPVGVGAAGYYHGGVPGLPPLMQWPPVMHNSMQGPVQMQRAPAIYNSMQGPVQLQRPPLMYMHNGQAPVQGTPVLKLYPPYRPAATVPSSLGPTMMMHPPNLAAGQMVRPPSLPLPPQQQQQMEDMKHQQQQQIGAMKHQQRVCAQVAAAIKLSQRAQQDSASCAGQQEIRPTASTQPACFDEGANHPAATEVMTPLPQFLAPHDFYPCSGVQQQQSSSAIPGTGVPPGGAAAPVEATLAAAVSARSKLSLPGDANKGSAMGNYYGYDNQLHADLAAELAIIDGITSLTASGG